MPFSHNPNDTSKNSTQLLFSSRNPSTIMCLSRNYKASTKAVNKLHFVKHELLATTTGKATAHVPQSIHNRRQQNTDAAPLTKSTAIPSLEFSYSTETTTTLSSNQNIADPSPLDDTFDFDFSFLQIPSGGVICIPRREEMPFKARTSGPSFASDMMTPTMNILMKPDPFDFSSLHKILGTFREETVLATAFTAATTSTRHFQGTVSSDDFVSDTPIMQRGAMSVLTPPTTPRVSDRDCVFADTAQLFESLMMTLL
jgi:hypothetical protein